MLRDKFKSNNTTDEAEEKEEVPKVSRFIEAENSDNSCTKSTDACPDSISRSQRDRFQTKREKGEAGTGEKEKCQCRNQASEIFGQLHKTREPNLKETCNQKINPTHNALQL